MTRRLFRVPAGCTALPAPGGRNGATRREIWRGRPGEGAYLGDMVRWQPEGEWSWQPSGLFDAAMAGKDTTVNGTLDEAAAAMTAAAETTETRNPALLTVAQAEAMLPPGPLVHTLTWLPGGSLGGQDQPRGQVLRLLAAATAIRRSGPQASAIGHGLAALSPWRSSAQAGPAITYIETGERRDQLHLAIGTYAGYLAGLASAADTEAAAAAVPPGQMPDYTEITAALRAGFTGRDHPAKEG